jgi:hypothetical protein
MQFLEDREQIALFTWVRLLEKEYPLLQLIYHTPNGGYRDKRTAAKLRAMGVKPGVWDIFIPAPSPLWVEMKVGKNKLTISQKKWKEDLEVYGYNFATGYTWVEAARAIGLHLGIPEDRLPS